MDDVVIRSGSSHLHVNLRGAEPTRWSVDGESLLWRSCPSIWPQTAPVLFPVVGWLSEGRCRHKGQEYAMGVHGFAAQKQFDLIDRSESAARFLLHSDSETRAVYPFSFRLEALYAVFPDGFSWTLKVSNAGSETMPYAIGIHPGFCWDWSETGGRFVFDKPEEPRVPIIASGGLFSRETKAIPMHKGVLPLEADTLAAEALCFLNVRSASARLVNSRGDAVEVIFENYDHVALWARPPAPFLCVECWTGYGDPVGFKGGLMEKPSMRFLEPDGDARHSVTFRLLPRAL